MRHVCMTCFIGIVLLHVFSRHSLQKPCVEQSWDQTAPLSGCAVGYVANRQLDARAHPVPTRDLGGAPSISRDAIVTSVTTALSSPTIYDHTEGH